MLNPEEIENLYKQYMSNLADLAHDGIINVDLALLHELNLLDEIAAYLSTRPYGEVFKLIQKMRENVGLYDQEEVKKQILKETLIEHKGKTINKIINEVYTDK